jgi:hypothetical protein
MEDKKIETPKRVLARVLADELEVVEGGMNAQQTYFSGWEEGTNTPSSSDVGSFGLQDTDQI